MPVILPSSPSFAPAPSFETNSVAFFANKQINYIFNTSCSVALGKRLMSLSVSRREEVRPPYCKSVPDLSLHLEAGIGTRPAPPLMHCYPPTPPKRLPPLCEFWLLDELSALGRPLVEHSSSSQHKRALASKAQDKT